MRDPAEFRCGHCGATVPPQAPADWKTRTEYPRNACPSCLWSRHVQVGTLSQPPCGALIRGTRYDDHWITYRCTGTGCGFMVRMVTDEYMAELLTKYGTGPTDRSDETMDKMPRVAEFFCPDSEVMCWTARLTRTTGQRRSSWTLERDPYPRGFRIVPSISTPPHVPRLPDSASAVLGWSYTALWAVAGTDGPQTGTGPTHDRSGPLTWAFLSALM